MKQLSVVALVLSGACGDAAPPIDASTTGFQDTTGSPGPATQAGEPTSATGTPDGETASPPDGGSSSTTSTNDADSGDSGTAGGERRPEFSFEGRTIYLVMPDRFANGDPDNDRALDPECTDLDDPGRFHGGDIDGLRERTDYFSELGIGAVWTTPMMLQTRGQWVNPCPYHGYWGDFVEPFELETDPRFGSLEEFERWRERLRRDDIGLVLDVVVNHTGDYARLVSQRPEWFHDPETCASLGDPVIYCPWRPGAPDFAVERPEVAQYTVDSVKAWLEMLEPEGIRIDTVRHLPASYLRDDLLPGVHDLDPDLFTLAEVFSYEWTELQGTLSTGVDSVFHFPLRGALVDSLSGRGTLDAVANALGEGYERLGAEQASRLVLFIDNHDVTRMTHEISAVHGTSDAAQQRYRLGLVILFSSPGVPMLYYGSELGMLGAGDPDNRRDMPSWAFDGDGRQGERAGYLGDPQATWLLTRRLIELRAQREALARGRFVEMWRPNGREDRDLFVMMRGTSTDRIVAAFNAGNQTVDVLVPVAANGSLEESDLAAFADRRELPDLLGQAAPAIFDGETLRVVLPPRTSAVFDVGE